MLKFVHLVQHPLLSCVQCILPFPGGKHVRAVMIFPPSDCNSVNEALQCMRLGLLQENVRLGDNT